jgi:hypothetical protein
MPKLIRSGRPASTLDVHMGGSPSLVRVYRPQDFPPFIARSDKSLLDDKAWNGGFASGFRTRRQYIYAYNMVTNNLGHVNCPPYRRTASEPEDVMAQLVTDRARSAQPRPGFATAGDLASYGEVPAKLFQRNRIHNSRRPAEWVVRGRYPSGSAPARLRFVRATGPDQERDGNAGGVGQDADVKLNQRQHRDDGQGAPIPTRQVCINWFLQKEQRQQWTDLTDTRPPPRHQAASPASRMTGQAIHRHFPREAERRDACSNSRARRSARRRIGRRLSDPTATVRYCLSAACRAPLVNERRRFQTPMFAIAFLANGEHEEEDDDHNHPANQISGHPNGTRRIQVVDRILK